MTAFVKYTLLCLALVLGSAAQGDDSAAQDECEMLFLLLPEVLQDLSIADCDLLKGSQVTITTTVTVPANRVIEIQDIMIDSYGMEPLRFACCGYETKPVTFPLPENHPLADSTPNGAFRSIRLSLFAAAFSEEDTEQTVHGLGEIDATITIEMVDY